MKKYETTKEHPELKEGLIIEMWSEGHELAHKYSTLKGLYMLFKNQLDSELKLGYIKEVQKKEFTKSDMIDLLKYVSSDFSVFSLTTLEDDVENYLKQRSK